MTTNGAFLNDANESDNDSQRMDDEKPSIIEEGEADSLTEKPHLAGPMTLLVCIRFIILSAENALTSIGTTVNLDGILEILSTNNADFDDDMDELQNFAKTNFLNLYICIINQNEKKFYYLNATSVEGNQQWPRAYLVFDKHNRSFYPFYTRDKNNKHQTIFSTNATHILNLFEKSVEIYKWPFQPEIIQQTLEQNVHTLDQENVLTDNFNYNIGNVDNQSKNKITASGVCNLFIQNVQNFMPQVGSQLDGLNYFFVPSEYQLRDTDLVSTKTVCEALIHRLRMLMELPDLASNHITETNNVHTSMETDETTTVRSPSSNNNEEDILRNPINTKVSLRLNAQSMPVTNDDRSPSTTNNFNEAINLPKSKLNNQPKRFRHNRERKTVGKGCPAVQVEGAPQRTPIQLKLSEEIRNYQQQFYIGTHVKTFDGNEHAQKRIAPKPAKINKNHECMQNEQDPDEYDLSSKGVFSKINENDLKTLEKKITVLMFNLKQDDDIDKNLIKENKLVWCRLMFAIYIKLSNGHFERVSPPTFSDLIKETNGAQSVNTNAVFPDKFCERGGQIIFIQLEELVEKGDLRVRCNGKVLDQNDYQIADTILSFETPECLQDTKDLEIVIDKQNIKDWIVIWTQYYSHDDHPEPCGVINKN